MKTLGVWLMFFLRAQVALDGIVIIGRTISIVGTNNISIIVSTTIIIFILIVLITLITIVCNRNFYPTTSVVVLEAHSLCLLT